MASSRTVGWAVALDATKPSNGMQSKTRRVNSPEKHCGERTPMRRSGLLHRFDFDFLPRRIGVRGDQAFRAVDADCLHTEFRVVNRNIFQRVCIDLTDVDFLLPVR